MGFFPIGSMYGIFTYIYHKNQPNVGKYTIHGSYGFRGGGDSPKLPLRFQPSNPFCVLAYPQKANEWNQPITETRKHQ